MVKFVDCLVRLPNLKTLDILGAGPRTPISKALKRKYATFPSIRELRIVPACHHFIKKCPNLETLIFARTLDRHAPSTVLSYGGGLKRVAGVSIHNRNHMNGKLFNASGLNDYLGEAIAAVTSGCPNLRELAIIGSIQVSILPGGYPESKYSLLHHSQPGCTSKNCDS